MIKSTIKEVRFLSLTCPLPLKFCLNCVFGTFTKSGEIEVVSFILFRRFFLVCMVKVLYLTMKKKGKGKIVLYAIFWKGGRKLRLEKKS